MLDTLAHDRHHRSMTMFEILKKRITQTVSSDSLEEKTMLLDESKHPHFFDGFDEIQVLHTSIWLKPVCESIRNTMRLSIWSAPSTHDTRTVPTWNDTEPSFYRTIRDLRY